MKAIFLSNIAMLLIGIVSGYYFFNNSSTTEKEVACIRDNNLNQIVKNEKSESQSTKTDQAKSLKKSIHKEHKYFSPKNNKQAKINSLLSQVQQKDHFPNGRGINMEIVDLYEEILRLNPKNIDALSQYSNYLITFNRFDEAKDLLEKCLASDPKNNLCLGNSTIHSLNQGNEEELKSKIDLCLKLRPHNSQCLNNKAYQFLREDKPKLALEYFKRLENSPSDGHSKMSKALIYLGYAQSYEHLHNTKLTKKYYELSCNEGQEYACKRFSKLSL